MSIRGLNRSVRVINESVTVCRRVRGLRKGLERRSGFKVVGVVAFLV